MKTSKQERRARALARFRVLPFLEWVGMHLGSKELPGTTTQQERLDLHEKYCERKAIERASLERGA